MGIPTDYSGKNSWKRRVLELRWKTEDSDGWWGDNSDENKWWNDVRRMTRIWRRLISTRLTKWIRKSTRRGNQSISHLPVLLAIIFHNEVISKHNSAISNELLSFTRTYLHATVQPIFFEVITIMWTKETITLQVRQKSERKQRMERLNYHCQDK